MAEYFVMDLPTPLSDISTAKDNLNKQMPPGLKVLDITLHKGSIPQQVLNSYELILHPELSRNDIALLAEFMETDNFIITRTRKRKTKEINIRPFIHSLVIQEDGTIAMEVISRASVAGVKPIEAIAAILGKEQEVFLSSEILKTGWQEL